MSARAITLFAVLVAGFALPPAAQAAAATNLTRREIRAMPIEKRPNRVGHFYGNAVRRRHNR